MLLAIDIGNTNIAFGVFRGKGLIGKLNLPTVLLLKGRGFGRRLKRDISSYNIQSIVIGSVVPAAQKPLMRVLRRMYKVRPLVLGKDIKVPIKNLYKRPGQVGQDRLINAYAAAAFYGAPLIIVDFGTAVTLDIISKNGAYLGGIIAPGIRLAIDALSEKTALLPKIRLDKRPPLIGKTTSMSIASGILHGYAAMCDGLIAGIRKKRGVPFKVVATGGNARLVAGCSSAIRIIEENLTLKGINLIFRRMKKSH